MTGGSGRCRLPTPTVLVTVPMPSTVTVDDVAGLQRRRVLMAAAAPQLGEAATVAGGARAEDVARRGPQLSREA